MGGGLPDAASLDLSRYSEATRRALYELAVAAYWGLAGEADEYEPPTFSPDEAELMILWERGAPSLVRHLVRPGAA